MQIYPGARVAKARAAADSYRFAEEKSSLSDRLSVEIKTAIGGNRARRSRAEAISEARGEQQQQQQQASGTTVVSLAVW